MGCCPISTTISSRSHCAYVPATGCRQRWNRTSEGQLWVEPPRRWGSRKVRIRRVLPVGVYQGEGPLTEPTGAAHPDRRLPLFRPRSCRALDPDFVIMARCDLGGVPGASFASCRSCSRPNLRSRSTSRPPRRWASPFPNARLLLLDSLNLTRRSPGNRDQFISLKKGGTARKSRGMGEPRVGAQGVVQRPAGPRRG